MVAVAIDNEFRHVARDEVFPNPEQPRKHFDQDALEELAQSLRENGMIQPITVTPRDGRFMIVAGERRWRASGIAGFETVPVRVMDLGDEMVTILAITENVSRQDMDEMEEAHAYGKLAQMGKTTAEIANLFGKTEKWISSSLELLNLNEQLQWLVARGQVSKNIGVYLSRLSAAGQQSTLNRITAGEFANNDALIRHIEVVQKCESQGDLFGNLMPAEDEITAARRKARKTELERAWDKLEGFSAGLTAFLEAAPEDLAFALNGDLDLYVRKLEVLATAVNKTRNNVRQAAAIAKVAAEGK